jgi:hypothetical protein
MLGLLIALTLVVIFLYIVYTYFTPRYVQIQRILTSRDMWFVSNNIAPQYMRFGSFKSADGTLIPTGTVIVTKYNGDKMYVDELQLQWKRLGDRLVIGDMEFRVTTMWSVAPTVTMKSSITEVSPWEGVLIDVKK